MSKIFKRLIAVTLSAVLILSAAGCNLYNENNLWVAEKDGTTLSVGGYIYFLNMALSSAASEVSTEEKVLKSTIDGENAETWIRNKALEHVKKYFYLHELFDELGLEFSEEDRETIDSNTDYMWSYYGTAYEAVGVSKDSLTAAYTEYAQRYSMIFDALYGPDGEKAVSDEEIKAYYEENNYNYEAIAIPVTSTDDEGNSVELDDEEKAKIKTDLEEIKEQIESGDVSMEAAASAYTGANQVLTDTTIYNANTGVIDEAATVFQNAILALEEGNMSDVVEDTTHYYLITRLPIADKSAEALEDESTRNSLLSSMKSDEFSDYMDEQSATVEGITYNESAMKSVSLSSLIGEDNEMGTSSAVSEDETSEESSTVSEESEVSEESVAVSSEESE